MSEAVEAPEVQLSEEQKQFLEECEAKYIHRFTKEDADYSEFYDKDIAKPPIMPFWRRHQERRGDQRRGDRREDRGDDRRYNRNRSYHQNNSRDYNRYDDRNNGRSYGGNSYNDNSYDRRNQRY